jgi:hypothetical protein
VTKETQRCQVEGTSWPVNILPWCLQGLTKTMKNIITHRLFPGHALDCYFSEYKCTVSLQHQAAYIQDSETVSGSIFKKHATLFTWSFLLKCKIIRQKWTNFRFSVDGWPQEVRI